MLASSLILSSLLAFASARPPVAKRATTYNVKVGAGGQLAFDPPAVFASVGDDVIFTFQAKNHSVTQSSFAEPCAHIPDGFDSGFQPVTAGTADADLPVVKYTVTDASKPLWFYCKQALHTPNSHCHAGMVFAINCPASGENSLDNFVAKAKNSSFAVNPAPPTPNPNPTDSITPLAPEPTYPGITVPPAETAQTKTDVITLGTSTWTTTYASYPNSPNPTPNAVDGNEIKVIVGGDNQLTFTPSRISAQPRDRVTFEFQSKNHSVVQSSFAQPCYPIQGQPGINSGFMPVTNGQPFPTFTIKINDTTPQWFFCSQPGHCGKGMVFAVNTDEQGPRNWNAFQNLAKQVNGTSDNSNNGYGGGGAAVGLRSNGPLAVAGLVAAVMALVL